MAEILLSLTIIGVVAAITLPSLTGNINERTWNTQRKALYARMSQAIALMPALNGYGTLEEGDPNNVAETFVTNGLAKVLKINNICDSGHLSDCGVPAKVNDLKGSVAFDAFPTTLVALNMMFSGSRSGTSEYYQTDTKAAAFETANGESVVVYYNPNCQTKLAETVWRKAQPKMCANFVYDLNGKKGPNTVGKDIGAITALYATDSVVVAPLPIHKGPIRATHAEAMSACKGLDEDSRVPNLEEAASVFFNSILFGLENYRASMWTSSRLSSDAGKGWLIELYGGTLWDNDISFTSTVQCIKR